MVIYHSYSHTYEAIYDMEALTPHHLLQVLPGLLYGWTALILVWGVLANLAVYEVSKKSILHNRVIRSSDKPALWLLVAVNVFLTWYLFTVESASCPTWIVVVNVFYTAHLTYVSIDVARWWRSLKQHYDTPPRYS